MNIIITKNNVKIEIQVNNAEETKTLENLINFLGLLSSLSFHLNLSGINFKG